MRINRHFPKLTIDPEVFDTRHEGKIEVKTNVCTRKTIMMGLNIGYLYLLRDIFAEQFTLVKMLAAHFDGDRCQILYDEF